MILLSLSGAFYLWSMSNEFSQKQIDSNQSIADTKNKLLKSNDVEVLRAIALNHYGNLNETIERNIETTKDLYQILLALAVIFSSLLFFILKVRKVLVSNQSLQSDAPKARC